MQPSQKEPRLPGPLGGPHLNASVLMRATYKGGHDLISLGKNHPQAPPLHIHFSQSESFLVEAGAVGTTTTYDAIDTVHTTGASYHQVVPRQGLSPPVPSRDEHVAVAIPPWTPHKFWPVAPTHPFWSTPDGQQYESSLPNRRNSDTTVLIWAYPKTSIGPPMGALVTDFPPDMDAAFFLALLSLVGAIGTNRVAMTPNVFVTLFSLQTASGLSVIMAPTAWWLGPLRWRVPWAAQIALEKVRELFGGKNVVAVAEDIIHNDIVKRQ
ncbi:hypothetical protein BJY01DRAFT_238989 [Aspergillus pseudoustus]|uniref:RmlC-like cupin domain-containing protein n=1 Tax=Aspergillus pseudoustus TaxID=1810923 RepID=A0ABR4J3Z8_9EURO